MNLNDIHKLLIELEYSDHHYDPSHSHSYSCPICGGCSPKGDLRSIHSHYNHTDDCKLSKAIKHLSY